MVSGRGRLGLRSALVALVAGLVPGGVMAGGSVTVTNGTGLAIKVVGEGGQATVPPGAASVEVMFSGGTEVGVDAKLWWVAKPRELCQLFVPWGRHVVASGTTVLRCRSE